MVGPSFWQVQSGVLSVELDVPNARRPRVKYEFPSQDSKKLEPAQAELLHRAHERALWGQEIVCRCWAVGLTAIAGPA
jgi:hypothetical protein